LPEINGTERQLHDPPAAVFLGPWRPKLASEPIQDEEIRHAGSGIREDVVAKIVVLIETIDSIGVHGCVEIYEESATTLGNHIQEVGDHHLLMLVWHKATTVRTAHFFLLEKL